MVTPVGGRVDTTNAAVACAISAYQKRTFLSAGPTHHPGISAESAAGGFRA